MERIFISGPMSGLSNYNRDRFNVVAEVLQGTNRIVLNPAVLPDGLDHDEYMRICFEMLTCCESILMLPNWEQSIGASAEHDFAKLHDMRIYYLETYMLDEPR